MKSYDFTAEVKRMKALAKQAEAMADTTGLMKWEKEVDYYKGLAEKLRDISWHYECLENEGVLKD